MAKFGRRFRKAKDRRQQRRSDAWAAYQQGRSDRVQARQTGKTDRSGYRNVRKADVVASKAQGGYYLPQSVQARQDTIGKGLNLATQAGLVAMGIPPIGGLGDLGLGMSNGGMSSPYGGGFATSGMESVYYDEPQEDLIFGIQKNIALLIGGGILLIFLMRKK
jgi:hypothetical protein